MFTSRRSPVIGSLLAMALSVGAMSESSMGFMPPYRGRVDTSLPPVDEDKRAIRRMTRKDRKTPKHKANKQRRGY